MRPGAVVRSARAIPVLALPGSTSVPPNKGGLAPLSADGPETGPGPLLGPCYHRGVRIGIVGGGIIGCSVAWRLARQGAAVTVFEQRGVGAGATHASAGALVPFVEAHESSPLQD